MDLKSKKTVVVVLLVLIASATSSLGEFYIWNPQARPSVSLPIAYDLAVRAIEDNESYCISVLLTGGKEGKSTTGFWTFVFSREDGKQYDVSVTMDSKVTVLPLVPKAFVAPMTIGSIADALQVLPDFLKSQHLDGDVSNESDALIVKVRTRQFQVHRLTASGDYSEDLVPMTGPASDGFVLTIREQPITLRPIVSASPYFRTASNRFAATKPSMCLQTELQYGHALPEEMVSRILRLFGDIVR